MLMYLYVCCILGYGFRILLVKFCAHRGATGNGAYVRQAEKKAWVVWCILKGYRLTAALYYEEEFQSS